MAIELLRSVSKDHGVSWLVPRKLIFVFGAFPYLSAAIPMHDTHSKYSRIIVSR